MIIYYVNIYFLHRSKSFHVVLVVCALCIFMIVICQGSILVHVIVFRISIHGARIISFS
jgi:hypothetical protein